MSSGTLGSKQSMIKEFVEIKKKNKPTKKSALRESYLNFCKCNMVYKTDKYLP